MDQETLINALAVVGALSLAYWLFRILAAIAAWVQRDAIASGRAAAKTPPPEPATTDLTSREVAVIAAAVQMAMGCPQHRIVHIQDVHGGQSWSAEGRWMHQTSHKPH